MKIEGVVLDNDAENFLDEIAEELVLLGCADAVARVIAAVQIARPDILPGPQDITGDHLIYHKSPGFWAKAIYYNRRDWWRGITRVF